MNSNKKYCRVSNSSYIDLQTFKLVSDIDFPFTTDNQIVYVPSYLGIPNNVDLPFNILNGEFKQHSRNFFQTDTIPFKLGNIIFNKDDSVSITFTDIVNKSRHNILMTAGRFDTTLSLNRMIVLDGNKKYSSSYKLNDCPTKAISDLANVCYLLPSKRKNHERSIELSKGMKKGYPKLIYKDIEMPFKYNVLFLEEYGILFNPDLTLAAIVLFSMYNNRYIVIDKWIYISSLDITKLIFMISRRKTQ